MRINSIKVALIDEPATFAATSTNVTVFKFSPLRIHIIEWMAVFAVCLFHIVTADTAVRIVGSRYQAQVLWVNASHVSAFVIDGHSFGNHTFKQAIRNAMCIFLPLWSKKSAYRHQAICDSKTSLLSRLHPKPAAIGLFFDGFNESLQCGSWWSTCSWHNNQKPVRAPVMMFGQGDCPTLKRRPANLVNTTRHIIAESLVDSRNSEIALQA